MKYLCLIYDEEAKLGALSKTEMDALMAEFFAFTDAIKKSGHAGLALIDGLLSRGALADYYLAHSARADLCRRLGRVPDARAAYERALSLTRQEPERRFLERRLAELPLGV